jgi:hypothetical protein
MSTKNTKQTAVAATDEAPCELARTNPERYRAMQYRCMDTFTKQQDAIRETAQTARFRFAGEWWNYWFYELWRIDPAGTTGAEKKGFRSQKEALEHYSMPETTFKRYRNEANAILRAVHGGVIPGDCVFTAKIATWAYQASREARLIESRGDLRLLSAGPGQQSDNDESTDTDIPEEIQRNLFRYYETNQAEIAARKAKSKKASKDKPKRHSIDDALGKMNEALVGMRLIWQGRKNMTDRQKNELHYILRMIELYDGAPAFDAEKKSDREMKDLTFSQAFKVAEDPELGADALLKANRFAYSIIIPSRD